MGDFLTPWRIDLRFADGSTVEDATHFVANMEVEDDDPTEDEEDTEDDEDTEEETA